MFTKISTASSSPSSYSVLSFLQSKIRLNRKFSFSVSPPSPLSPLLAPPVYVVYMWACRCTGLCTHIWKSEIDIGGFLQSLL